MQFHRGHLAAGDQAVELAIAHAMVRLASRGVMSEAVRIYRPSAPVAVFGRRDTHLPGFAAAARAASAAGFEPLVRATGGRAVAYTSNAIVVDHVRHDPDVIGTHDTRFRKFGEALAEAFRGLGLDARVGAVPGEYCPGAYSVNAHGTVKLVGTAQRIVKNAWLFSSLIIVGDEERLRPVLAEVYGLLAQPFNVESVGSVSSARPALTVDVVEQALIEALGVGASDGEPLPPEVLQLAQQMVDQHRI